MSTTSKCNFCQQEFAHIASLRRHIEKLHNTARYECNKCHEKDFSSLYWLNCHVEKIHQGVSCHVCDKPFSSGTSLKVHVEKVHGDAESHKCRYFDFTSFFFKFSYEYFDLTSFCFKLLIWFFYFSYCDKELKLFVDLRKHIFNIHNLLDHVVPSQIKFDCSQCEKKFIREELLKSHVELIHQGYR